jgi:polar amino acid transport system substrate-binding protein
LEVHVKKIVTALAAVAVAVGLTAGPAGARPQADPPGLKTPGQLTVGLSMPSPGFQNVTPLPSGNNVLPASSVPKGQEIDMVKAIAKELGLKKIVYIQHNFQNMYLPGPKKWHIGLAEMTITAERKKNIDFSVSYLNANQGVMVRKGLSPLPKSIADLKNIVLCAQIGTTGAAYIKDRVKPNKKALYPQTTTIMYQQLKTKRCDAALYDAPILGAQKFQEPKAYGPIVGQIITNEQYGAAFQKGDPIRTPVNKAIKKLLANGTIGKLSTKWLTFDASKLPVFK